MRPTDMKLTKPVLTEPVLLTKPVSLTKPVFPQARAVNFLPNSFSSAGTVLLFVIFSITCEKYSQVSLMVLGNLIEIIVSYSLFLTQSYGLTYI